MQKPRVWHCDSHVCRKNAFGAPDLILSRLRLSTYTNTKCIVYWHIPETKQAENSNPYFQATVEGGSEGKGLRWNLAACPADLVSPVGIPQGGLKPSLGLAARRQPHCLQPHRPIRFILGSYHAVDLDGPGMQPQWTRVPSTTDAVAP